jgi:hypothetical protein
VTAPPDTPRPDDDADADQVDEREPAATDDGVNDAERRYGHDENPA